MRKWLIAALVLVALGGAGVALVAVNLNRFLERNHDWIREQVAAAAGRDVSFDRVRVRLWPGVGVRVENLGVSEDRAFGPGDFLRAHEIDIALHLLPALIGRYQVGRVRIDRPEITVIRAPQGLSVASLGAPQPTKPANRPAAEGAQRTAPPASLAAVLVSRFELHDATIRFTDRRAAPPAEMQLDHLDIDLSNIGLGRPIGVAITASLFGDDRRTVKVEGTVGPIRDLSGAGAPIDVAVRVGPIDLAKVRAHPPPAVSLPAGLDLGGSTSLDVHATGTLDAPHVHVEFDAALASIRLGTAFDKARGVALGATADLVRTPSGVDLSRAELRLDRLVLIASGKIGGPPVPAVALRCDGERLDVSALGGMVPALRGVERGGTATMHLEIEGPIGDGKTPELRGRFAMTGVSGKVADIDFQALEATATIADQMLSLPHAGLRTFGGSITTTGRVDFRDRDRPRLDISATVQNVDVAAAAASRSPTLAGRLAGRLDSEASLSGVGSDWDHLRPTLHGTAHGKVRDALLKDVNLVDDVLGKLGGIPGISTLVPPKIRTKYPALFSTGDTRFDQLEGDFRVADAHVITENLVASARDFAATAKGTVTFEGQTDLSAVLVASPGLTTDIAGEVKEARYLIQKDGRLAIPFQVVGVAPKLRAQPDIGFLTQAVGQSLMGQGLERLLGGHKKSGNTQKPAAEKDLLKNGLDSLFGR